MTHALAKQAAAEAAIQFIQPKMTVGIGSGSTVAFFIKALAKKYREGLDITVVAASTASETLAAKEGLPLADINLFQTLSIAVDGADEIDGDKNMIKGGGGALLREKIIATMSKEMVVIVDEGKVVKTLGAFPLAIEILPFAHLATKRLLEKTGYPGALRMDNKKNPYITDNGNFIYDLHLKAPLPPLYQLQALFKEIPGVVETGLFLEMAGRVVVGHKNGEVEILP